MTFDEFIMLVEFIKSDYNKNYQLFIDKPKDVLDKLSIKVNKEEEEKLLAFIRESLIYLIGKTEAMQISEGITKGLSELNDKIKVDFNRSAIMYIFSFWFGIILILVAIGMGIFTKKDVTTLILGGAGVANSFIHFIYNPILKLQESRARYAQLLIIYYNWFKDHAEIKHLVATLVHQDKLPTDEVLKRYLYISDILYRKTQECISSISSVFAEDVKVSGPPK